MIFILKMSTVRNKSMIAVNRRRQVPSPFLRFISSFCPTKSHFPRFILSLYAIRLPVVLQKCIFPASFYLYTQYPTRNTSACCATKLHFPLSGVLTHPLESGILPVPATTENTQDWVYRMASSPSKENGYRGYELFLYCASA